MGVVYRAIDTRLDRRVAVKILRPAEDADEQRFLAEVRILAGFNHANLVRLLDAGDFDGRPYLVMDLIDGPTLSQRLASGGLTHQQSARIGADVANALAYVHERGVVHRDVKPANVLVDDAGVAHLTDFGIARLIDTTGVTATGLTLGTPAYLAPEQVQGIGVGSAADVYALGLVLVECVSGRRAFEGTASELAAARLTREVDIPSDLGAGWEEVLRSMTARNPAARIAAADAALALSRLSQIEDSSVAPVVPALRGDDLTEMAAPPLAVGTELLGATVPAAAAAGVTVTSFSPVPVARRLRRGVLTSVVIGASVVAVLVGLFAGGVFSFSPAAPSTSTTTSTLKQSPTTSSSTTTTTSTSIPLPSEAAAAASLQSVLESGASDGSIAYPVAQQLDQQLQALLGATGGAGSTQQVQAFDQFVQTFDQAVAAGTITGDTSVANLTAGIATLAAALGTTVPTTVVTTTIPVTGSGNTGSGNTGAGDSGSGNTGNTGAGNSGSGNNGNGVGRGHGH
jgi:serine/threonine protein kinase